MNCPTLPNIHTYLPQRGSQTHHQLEQKNKTTKRLNSPIAYSAYSTSHMYHRVLPAEVGQNPNVRLSYRYSCRVLVQVFHPAAKLPRSETPSAPRPSSPEAVGGTRPKGACRTPRGVVRADEIRMGADWRETKDASTI